MAFIGKINGRTYRNGTNVTYQSLIDGELVYEYQIKHKYKKSASFICAGCRSASRDGRMEEDLTSKPGCLSGKINFDTRTVITNANESYHSSLNFVIPENRFDFRLCFLRYKESLAAAANDYLRSQNGELMKSRKPKYVESERRIMQRKAEMKLLYERYQENGIRPELDILLTYCSRQAWNSTEAMEENQQDPRFALQPVAALPPILPPNPRPNPQPVQQQQFVHPYFGVQDFNFPQMRQMLHQPIRPQYFIPQPQQQPFYQHFNPVYRF